MRAVFEVWYHRHRGKEPWFDEPATTWCVPPWMRCRFRPRRRKWLPSAVKTVEELFV